MAGVVKALLRAGLAVKLAQLRQATASYFSDRMDEGRATVTGYAIGAAFYAAAGIFLIAALLVGATALFRWVEMRYGLFSAFGAMGGALVLLTIICAIIAAASMRPKAKSYPSLGSRLRVALHAGPPKRETKPQRPVTSTTAPAGRPAAAPRDTLASARNTATSVLRASPAPRSRTDAKTTSPAIRSAGAAAAVGLLGWALARRYGTPAEPVRTPRLHR